MCDANSNCSRIDAAKAKSHQLQIQLSQNPRNAKGKEAVRKARGEIQALDTQIKTGDAKRAELAISTAVSAVKDVQTENSAKKSGHRGFEALA